MPKPNKAAESAAKTSQAEVDLKPKFETPNEGGSYIISKEDSTKAGAKPVFVSGTDREQTEQEKKAAEKIVSKQKAPASE